MSASLMEKARTVVLGNLHALLDKAVNTVEGYAQKIRDLQSAIADLHAAQDEANGSIVGLQRDRTKAQDSAADKRKNATLLLSDNDPDNDKSATALVAQAQALDAQVAAYDAQISTLVANRDQVGVALGQLETHLAEMQANLQNLRITQAASKAKNQAASAAEQASGAVDAANAADYDSIAAAINHEGDVADARFNRVIGGLSMGSGTPEHDVADAKAQAEVAALKAQIATSRSSQ